ncbi:metallophosphoesterase [candidate division KSB1 bacterium]
MDFLARTVFYLTLQLYLLIKITRMTRLFFSGKTKRYVQAALGLFFIWVNIHGFYISFVGSIWSTPPEWQVYLFVYPFFGWLTASVILLVLYLVIDCISFIVWSGTKLTALFSARFASGERAEKIDSGRRRFMLLASAGLTVPPIAASTYAVIFSSRDFYINTMELHFPRLPENLRGLKIAQVSDYHCSMYTTTEVIAQTVGIVNDAKPDFIFLTGDFVPREADYIYPCMDAVKNFKARYGTFATLGNHDYWADAPLITREIERHGIPVFVNRGVTLNIRDEKLNILGVDDLWEGTPDINAALKTVEKGPFNILMSHQPPYWDEVTKHGIELTLSGHTHGGQIGVELLGMGYHVGELFNKYNKGLFKSSGCMLYVNQGIGFTGPPIRVNTPPEITLITLT